MEINNTLYSEKRSINTNKNKKDSNLFIFDPYNTDTYSINSSKYEDEEDIYPSISMIPKKYKDEDEEEESEEQIEEEEGEEEEESEEEEEKRFVINEDITRIRPLKYSYKKFIDSDISRISGRTNYIFDDSFEDFKDIIEMPENLSLYCSEPDLLYDNEESFTKEVDNMIEKYSNCPIKDSKLNILMIAEKPSIARTITKFLSGNKYKIYHHQTMTIFTFKGYFKTIKSYFTVTSVKGHIYENEYIQSYDKSKPTKSYDYNIIKVVKKKCINIPKFLRYIAKNKDILCLLIDCDPEGENICYEVIRNVLPNMNKKNYQQIYRANFSSLTYRDINNAFDNLNDYPDCELSMSVDARSIIDYKVGISFSNLLTHEVLEYLDIYEIRKRKDLEEIFRNKYILYYGPCQTPALYFCVQRRREIEKFIPSILYKIYVEIITNEGKIYKIYMGRKFDKKKMPKLYLMI